MSDEEFRPLSSSRNKRLGEVVETFALFKGEGLVSYFEVVRGPEIIAHFYIDKGSSEFRNRVFRIACRRVCRERGWKMYEDSFQIVITWERIPSDMTLGELYVTVERNLEEAVKSLDKELRRAVRNWRKQRLQ